MKPEAKEQKTGWPKIWREWIKPILIVLLVLAMVRSAVADWNDVPTGSMKPTILEGDRIFVNKLAYDLKVPFFGWRVASWSAPRRGDIIVFASPEDGTRMVKRVVGLPGDQIELRENRLWVNGKPADYSPLNWSVIRQLDAAERSRHAYAEEQVGNNSHAVMVTPQRELTPDFGPITVPLGHYFVMGDNRDNSRDSRFFGYVPRGTIEGKATAVALSFDTDDGFSPRWDRFFSALD